MHNKAWNYTEILPKDELMSLAKQFTQRFTHRHFMFYSWVELIYLSWTPDHLWPKLLYYLETFIFNFLGSFAKIRTIRSTLPFTEATNPQPYLAK